MPSPFAALLAFLSQLSQLLSGIGNPAGVPPSNNPTSVTTPAVITPTPVIPPAVTTPTPVIPPAVTTPTSVTPPAPFVTSSSVTPSSPAITPPANVANIVPKKAGLSGYVGIQNISAFEALAPYIGWYSDYNPDTPDSRGVQGVPMLWGASGSLCLEAPGRQSLFEATVAKATPKLMFGFYEPDCFCPDSSQMPLDVAARNWNNLLAPLAAKGTVLGSPSMCKQFDEDFLTPFKPKITAPWEITSIHVNKPDMAGVIADVTHYRKYGKPIWISEFACVYDQNQFTACTNQTQINQFIIDAVNYFESQADVIAYGPSNGAGLGTVWPLTNSAGQLTATGTTYLNVVKRLAGA